MYSVCGTTITMIRGDTFIATVKITRGNKLYIPAENDVIKFAAARKNETVPRLIKVVPNDTMELHLLPEDTKDLPTGMYKYDMEITFEDGSKDTFINKAILNLKADICP